MGEIPAALPSRDEQFLFAATERLFSTVKFHGIFGIEWLREETTGAFYLIDFNARPFLTIGHLRDCGVNLPLLAHRELTGQSLGGVEPRPAVKRKRWVYLSQDIDTFRELRATGRLGFVRLVAVTRDLPKLRPCPLGRPVARDALPHADIFGRLPLCASSTKVRRFHDTDRLQYDRRKPTEVKGTCLDFNGRRTEGDRLLAPGAPGPDEDRRQPIGPGNPS